MQFRHGSHNLIIIARRNRTRMTWINWNSPSARDGAQHGRCAPAADCPAARGADRGDS